MFTCWLWPSDGGLGCQGQTRPSDRPTLPTVGCACSSLLAWLQGMTYILISNASFCSYKREGLRRKLSWGIGKEEGKLLGSQGSTGVERSGLRTKHLIAFTCMFPFYLWQTTLGFSYSVMTKFPLETNLLKWQKDELTFI